MIFKLISVCYFQSEGLLCYSYDSRYWSEHDRNVCRYVSVGLNLMSSTAFLVVEKCLTCECMSLLTACNCRRIDCFAGCVLCAPATLTETQR